MIVYGHRGARYEAPENTLVAFARAAEIGLEAVEFDVRMSRDGGLVVIHDVGVDRTTDGEGDVADLDLDLIRGLDAREAALGWQTPAVVPTLDEVLAATTGFARLEIEIKRDSGGRDTALLDGLLAEVDGSVAERAVLTSFHPDLLLEVRRRRPELALGLIGRFDHPGWVRLAEVLGVVRAGVQQPFATPAVVAELLAAGLSVLGWPCNTAADLAQIRALGITEAVTSDAPSTILELLAAD